MVKSPFEMIIKYKDVVSILQPIEFVSPFVFDNLNMIKLFAQYLKNGIKIPITVYPYINAMCNRYRLVSNVATIDFK